MEQKDLRRLFFFLPVIFFIANCSLLPASGEGSAKLTLLNHFTAAGTGVTSSLNPYVHSVFVAGTSIYAGTQSGVFISRDTGKTWSNPLPAETPYPRSGVQTMYVDGAAVYAGSDEGLFISRDEGNT
jgi:photosystem II stability/assembly factor-like uncharacterized protein